MIRNNSDAAKQTRLPFVHRTAATSREAYVDSRPLAPDRKQRIRNHLRLAGRQGLTRSELAEYTGIGESSICGLVNRMIRAGELVESGDTRPTATGSKAKIVRLREFSGSADRPNE